MQPSEKINAVDSSDCQNFIEKWNSIEEDSIVYIYDAEHKGLQCCEIFDIERIKNTFNNDDRVLIITTDFLVSEKNNEIEFVLYHDSDSIGSFPFFIKKKSQIKIPQTNNNLKLEIFKTALNSNYLFEHIAEPYFKVCL